VPSSNPIVECGSPGQISVRRSRPSYFLSQFIPWVHGHAHVRKLGDLNRFGEWYVRPHQLPSPPPPSSPPMQSQQVFHFGQGPRVIRFKNTVYASPHTSTRLPSLTFATDRPPSPSPLPPSGMSLPFRRSKSVDRAAGLTDPRVSVLI